MTIERWGAFSVIDHVDDRRLAAEVLLYDRLLIPTPMDWDIERWHRMKWDPDGLVRKMAQLGDEIVIKAAWDQDRQKDWADKFGSLSEDQRDINSALQMSRRVLVDQNRVYRPPGVTLVEAIAAYQSEEDFLEFDLRSPACTRTDDGVERVTALIAFKIAVPDDPDPSDALKRAIDLALSDQFRRNRRQFFDWQREMLRGAQTPEDIAAAIPSLVAAYNEALTKSRSSYAWRTGVLCLSLGLASLGVAAGLGPEAFTAVGLGPLSGGSVVQIGSFSVGGLIQLGQHLVDPAPPEFANGEVLAGAMFHQISQLPGRKIRH